MAFLSREMVVKMGFKSVGSNVYISEHATFYNCKNISIGNNVRVDDFCVFSAGAGIEIGAYVHIAAHCLVLGAGLIKLSDFSGLSSRVSLYSSTDDYSGSSMTNPMVPDDFKKVYSADVTLGKHVIVGSGSVVLPGITLEDGVAIGALSLVTKDCKAFGVYAGNPVRRIKERKRDLLEFENNFIKKE